MLLSVESIHSMCNQLILIICVDFDLVLVLVRAWAIWGIQKRIKKILIASYVIYVILQLAGATYGLKVKPRRLPGCIFRLLFR